MCSFNPHFDPPSTPFKISSAADLVHAFASNGQIRAPLPTLPTVITVTTAITTIIAATVGVGVGVGVGVDYFWY